MKNFHRLIACIFILSSTQTFAADVYLSQNGNNNNDGLSSINPVATLTRAIEISQNHLNKDDREVRIIVESGIYTSQNAKINIDKKLGKISILGASSEPSGFPIFDGSGSTSTWLAIKGSKGIETGITIQGLHIRNYFTAISLDGNRDDYKLNNSGTVIRNNYFSNIGSISSIDLEKESTAAIRLVNSKNNLIEGNYFKSIRNKKSCSLLHSIYIAHYSSGNKIINNTFNDICGSAIKFRDRSGDNLIQGNKFLNLNNVPAIEEWFCDMSARKDCTKKIGECPSSGNLQQGNTIFNSGLSPLISIKGNRELRPWCTQDDFARDRVITGQ